MPADTATAEHFATPRQQRRGALLGMWLFLASEVMMFGGLFMGIIVYRVGAEYELEAASRHLDPWLGALNTAVLLTSSLAMALAVVAARRGAARAACGWLLATIALGATFLAVKAHEYAAEYAAGLFPHAGPAYPLEGRGLELFFNLYFAATGLHAQHLAVGLVLLIGLAARIALGRTPLPGRRITVETVGLYWHFVDVVWVFLFPALYLVGR